jgi:hypothetical protein
MDGRTGPTTTADIRFPSLLYFSLSVVLSKQLREKIRLTDQDTPWGLKMGVGGRGTVQELLAVETHKNHKIRSTGWRTTKIGRYHQGGRGTERFCCILHTVPYFLFSFIFSLVDIMRDFHFIFTTN